MFRTTLCISKVRFLQFKSLFCSKKKQLSILLLSIWRMSHLFSIKSEYGPELLIFFFNLFLKQVPLQALRFYCDVFHLFLYILFFLPFFSETPSFISSAHQVHRLLKMSCPSHWDLAEPQRNSVCQKTSPCTPVWLALLL